MTPGGCFAQAGRFTPYYIYIMLQNISLRGKQGTDGYWGGGRLFFEYIVVFQINCGISLAEGLEGVAHGLGVGVAELAAEGDGGVLVDKVLEMDNILRGELAATEQ